MRHEPDPENPNAELTPWVVILMALMAVLVQLLLSQLLFHGFGASVAASFGIALLLGFGGALAMAAPFIPDPPAQSLGVRAAPLSAWLAVPLLLPTLLLASELDNVIRMLARVPVVPDTGEALQVAEWVLVQMLVLPAVSELFYRGALQPRLVQSWGDVGGILGTAAVTGAASALLFDSLLVTAPAMAAALVLGVLRHCSGSILPGLLLASLFGAIGLLATANAFGIPGFDDLTAAHTPLAWLAPAAALVAAGLALCRNSATKLDGPPSRDGGPSRSGQIGS